ncbi:hypothetical protein CPB85DRAFT_1560962 [Mucidula mucida]|nr:hypothetical protein CPB85DRAFT_1560962 [Mucidula mucida]
MTQFPLASNIYLSVSGHDVNLPGVDKGALHVAATPNTVPTGHCPGQVLGQCREFSPSYPHGLTSFLASTFSVAVSVALMITTRTTPDVVWTSLRMTPRRRGDYDAQLWSPGFESSEKLLFTPPFILIPVYAMLMLHQPGDSKTCQTMLTVLRRLDACPAKPHHACHYAVIEAKLVVS